MTRRAKALALALFYALVGTSVLFGDVAILFQVLTGCTAFLAWVFVGLYGLRSPWRRTVVGRSLMYVWLALTAVLTLVFFSYWLGAYPGRDYLRVLVYSTLIPAFGSFITVLVQQQTGRTTGRVPPKVDTDL